VGSQAVMPQEGSLWPQKLKQQLPVPFAPHCREMQASFSVQAPMALWGTHTLLRQ